MVFSLGQGDLGWFDVGLCSALDTVKNRVNFMMEHINNSYLEGEKNKMRLKL